MANIRMRYFAGRLLGRAIFHVCRARYQLEVRGLDNYTCSPSTLVVFNHRRDADTPIIGNVLLTRHSLFSLDRPLALMGREDMFRTGFLTYYLQNWPSSLRGLLVPLNLRPVFWLIHAFPMRRIPERRLGEVLESVLTVVGDVPLGQMLALEWTKRFERLAGSENAHLTTREALARRFRPLLWEGYGLTKLWPQAFRAIKAHERAGIESQLQFFTDVLDRGGIVVMAPEGAVSQDGHFARLRTGLHALLERSRAPVRVLPVGITYDSMTCGRQRAFVNFGQEILGLQGLRRREVTAQVAEAILRQTTVTASQLASELFAARRTNHGVPVSVEQVADHIAGEAARWSKAGVYVDPRLLDNGSLARRAADYVEYCLQSGSLTPAEGGGYLVCEPNPPSRPGWADPLGAIDYGANEITSLSHLLGALQGDGATAR